MNRHQGLWTIGAGAIVDVVLLAVWLLRGLPGGAAGVAIVIFGFVLLGVRGHWAQREWRTVGVDPGVYRGTESQRARLLIAFVAAACFVGMLMVPLAFDGLGADGVVTAVAWALVALWLAAMVLFFTVGLTLTPRWLVPPALRPTLDARAARVVEAEPASLQS